MRTIQYLNPWRLNSVELLIEAFGRPAVACGPFRKNCDIVVCSGHRITRKKDVSEMSEQHVLGTFDAEVRSWTFDFQRKRLCAGLASGVLTLVSIIESQ